MKFNAKYALSENLIIWYFYKDLKPSIKLWINEKKQELDSWKELNKKPKEKG